MRQFLQRWKVRRPLSPSWRLLLSCSIRSVAFVARAMLTLQLALDSRREHSAPMNRSEGPPPSRPPLSAPLLGPSSGPGLVPTRPPAAASFSPSATRGPRLLPPIFRSRMPSELGAGLAAP